MIILLEKNDYARVRDLYRPLDFHLAAASVLEGNNPGWVWVDDPAAPQTSFMISPEGCYLAGNPSNDSFNRALNAAIQTGKILGPDIPLALILASDDWITALSAISQPRTAVPIARRHYVYPATSSAPAQAALPDGFTLHRIDAALLERPGLTIPEHVRGWISNNWGSTEAYWRDGFGFATVHQDEIVCWSLADCVSTLGCEIGIHTAQDYRRRGLAAITVAAAVDHALGRGLPLVGWQCSEDNPGSWGTAEKVGFTLERCYILYYVMPAERQ
jgi:RimJ/RimL family protein N-acetyltransferase